MYCIYLIKNVTLKPWWSFAGSISNSSPQLGYFGNKYTDCIDPRRLVSVHPVVCLKPYKQQQTLSYINLDSYDDIDRVCLSYSDLWILFHTIIEGTGQSTHSRFTYLVSSVAVSGGVDLARVHGGHEDKVHPVLQDFGIATFLAGNITETWQRIRGK